MEILRSNVMNSVENVEDKPALGGLFGSEGFFFQQRRGHLDLRSIAAINLERLVREVDVDVLQMHIENITFCNLREEDLRYLTDPQIVKLFRISQLMLEYLLYSQDKLVDNLNNLSHKYSEKKRGLSKKRRELVELEESTKLLRNQVKAKKQNIATLEDLLKEANRTREKELRKLRMQKGAEVPDEKPSIVKFFIAGPEGLCVEFVEKAETKISQLLREARKAFISVRDHDYSYDPNLVEVRLVFKGRLLLPEQTIEECGIRAGDTLMALLVEPKRQDTVPTPLTSVAPAAIPAVDPEHFTRQMFEIMSKQNQEQMREIVQDINSGWKTALETISSSNKPVVIEREREPASQLDNQALADMQGRWSRSELALQLKLEEVQHKQAMSDQELSALQILAMRRRMQLGDLESDEDPPARREAPAAAPAPAPGLDTGLFMGRIERVEHQTTYTSLDVERMRAELDEMKRLMALRPEPAAPVVVTAPAPVPVPEPVKPKEFRVVTSEPELVKTRSNKWDALQNMKSAAPVQAPAPVPVVAPKAVIFEMEPAPKPVEVVIPVQEPPAKPPVKAPKPALKPAPVVEVVPEPLGDVDVGFPAQFNPELAVLLGTKDTFNVTVPADIPVDDLLFELRKAASTKTRTKFAKVALEYKGQRALLGIDLDGDGADMTAQAAREAAATGDLRLVMMPGHPLTNAQIDMLVPSWEKNKVFTSGGVSASEDENRGKSAAGSKARLKKKRDWDEGESLVRQSGTSVRNDADEDDKMDPGTLDRGAYRQMRTSLDEALSEISEKEGLTDDELQRRIAKMKDDSCTLPKGVSDHLRNYKGSMVGALAAAAAAESGSDTAGGTDEMLRTSTGGMMSAREGMLSRSVSMSLSLPRREGSFGSAGSLLRMSGASSARSSPAMGENLNASMSSMGSKTRRSLEQYDDEDGLNSNNFLDDDTPMLASLTSSAGFRRQSATAPIKNAAPVGEKPPARVASGVGIAQSSASRGADLETSRTGGSLSSTLNADSDSLMYSPSVSVSARPNMARSRYSTEGNDTEEEEEEHIHQPAAKPAARPEGQEDFRGRWAKHDADASAEDAEGASWAAAGRPVDISAQSFGDDEPDYHRADAKNTTDRSVDSYKREFRAGKNARDDGGFKGEMSVTESDDRFRNTGDHTAMSSIPTLNESVTSFGDQDASYFQDHGEGAGGNARGSLGNTSESDLAHTGHSDLTNTAESDGGVLLPRGGGPGAAGNARGHGSNRSNNVQSFNDDEGSINSLALSDSNNLDE